MRRSSVTLLVVAVGALLPGTPVAAQDFAVADEARVHAMVNATRAEHGLPPLQRVGALDTLAREQSVRMVDQGRLFHNPDLKANLDALHLDWHWSGENVGVGPDVDAIEQAFLGSPHHFENILRSNYTALGVGVLASKSGYLYVTQVFAELGRARPNLPDPPPASAATPQPAATDKPAADPPTSAPTPKPPDPIVIEGGIIAAGPIP